MDLDDLWAIAECYGFTVDEAEGHHVTTDALPRLRELFQRHKVQSTLFVVGRDLEHPPFVQQLKACLDEGHEVANHSNSHRLDFRNLTSDELKNEIEQCDGLLQEKLQRKPLGFRAPGYGHSDSLLEALNARAYLYDSSLMPGPYGAVFRWLDGRHQKRVRGQSGSKTQYSLLKDAARPLAPHRRGGQNLVEIPAATSPLLRLPFQAGVCMRLGRRYFDAQLNAFAGRSRLPFVFLLHAADIADFSTVKHPFFQQAGYFSMPVQSKIELLDYFLTRIREERGIVTTESWLQSGEAETFIPGS
ncbi:MAG: polysaccharide deacetylase family protein [Candidatus Sumerlaeaceae bacterium]